MSFVGLVNDRMLSQWVLFRALILLPIEALDVEFILSLPCFSFLEEEEEDEEEEEEEELEEEEWKKKKKKRETTTSGRYYQYNY